MRVLTSDGYGAQGISNGEGLAMEKNGWMHAHRTALLAGEFDDDCDHGTRLPLCPDPECVGDYIRIVESYL